MRIGNRSLPAITLAMLAVMACSPAEQQPAPSTEDAVTTVFEPLNEGLQPGAAVLVMKDGEVVYREGFGFADLENKVRITPESVFRLGSVSKQFTTMAIMVLAEQGKLDYDDLLSKHIPELDSWPGVTLRHMMYHTSGIPDFYERDFYADYDPEGPMVQNDMLVEVMARYPEPDFAPGEKYVYNNAAYDLLPVVVQRVTGESFYDFVRREVLAPAGMATATPFSATAPAIPNRVYGYAPAEDGFVLDDYDPFNTVLGSGSMYATLYDFAAWERSLTANSVVSAETLQEACTEATLNDGSGTAYGFGWRIGDYRGHKRIMHGGSWVGFRTAFARYPEDGLAIAVLTNRADAEPSAFVDRIADIYLPEAGSGDGSD
jgi:CubicO group peptidase (beta-lactamase class C family)